VVYLIFDVFSLDGTGLIGAPYSERRAQLEELDLYGVYWRTPETFDDGEGYSRRCASENLKGSSQAVSTVAIIPYACRPGFCGAAPSTHARTVRADPDARRSNRRRSSS
jgi:hypothetical protein